MEGFTEQWFQQGCFNITQCKLDKPWKRCSHHYHHNSFTLLYSVSSLLHTKSSTSLICITRLLSMPVQGMYSAGVRQSVGQLYRSSTLCSVVYTLHIIKHIQRSLHLHQPRSVPIQAARRTVSHNYKKDQPPCNTANNHWPIHNQK